MAEQFYTILTNTGKAKIANSLPTGTKVNLTTLKVGDSNGTYYNPSETQTDLVHTVYSCNVTSVEVDSTNSNWINITSVIPSDQGGFTIREVGVFDDGGNLIAIGKYPETYKPTASDGSTKELYLKMTLEVSNSSSVTLKIDPTVILATKSDINTLTTSMNNSISTITSQLNDIANDICNKGASPLLDDNTEIIQKELNKKGHVVISKPGTYLTKGLVIYDNTFFELYPGVELKLMNGTHDYLLRNEYALNSDKTNKNINIKIKGGIWNGNCTGENGITGTFGEGKFPGWGVFLNHIEFLKLEDMFLKNYSKYCFHIVDCNNLYTNNIGFNNESDGLHFQPPLKNAFINNTYGTTGDDMIAFTLGDFPKYVVSQEGNFENIIVDGVNADSCVGFVKITGSGLDSKYVFKNISINNLNGKATRYIASIIEDRTYDTGGLNKTICENISFNHVKVSNSKFLIDTYKANLYFSDISIDYSLWFEIDYRGIETDSEVNLTIDNAYSPYGKSIDTTFMLIQNNANINNMILNNFNINLNAVPLIKILSGGKFNLINANNVNCKNTGDTTKGMYFYEEGGFEDEATILMNNSTFTGFLNGEMYHSKITVRHSNCELLNTKNSTYVYSGAIVKVNDVNTEVNGTEVVESGGSYNDFWEEANLVNGWVKYGNENARYYKDSTNVVHLDCVVTGGTVDTVIFKLPDRLKPRTRMWFPVNSNEENRNVYGMVQIDKYGNVKFVTGGTSYVGLSNICFNV